MARARDGGRSARVALLAGLAAPRVLAGRRVAERERATHAVMAARAVARVVPRGGCVAGAAVRVRRPGARTPSSRPAACGTTVQAPGPVLGRRLVARRHSPGRAGACTSRSCPGLSWQVRQSASSVWPLGPLVTGRAVDAARSGGRTSHVLPGRWHSRQSPLRLVLRRMAAACSRSWRGRGSRAAARRRGRGRSRLRLRRRRWLRRDRRRGAGLVDARCLERARSRRRGPTSGWHPAHVPLRAC